jgi:hypothetical protein
MEFTGIVQNGVVVVENAPMLPEGTRVRISVEPTEADCVSLRDFLLKHAGMAPGLPSDLAEQHDHYIHGTPK